MEKICETFKRARWSLVLVIAAVMFVTMPLAQAKKGGGGKPGGDGSGGDTNCHV